ncbi:ComEC/Rec2 family competence protein, partial [bacterium]|nr:ComEC/Rec2 family competence protein [bacterium]
MIRNILNFTVQNKNFLMLMTAIVYIMGVFAYFTNLAIVFCAIVSVFAIIGLLKNLVSVKLVLLWIFVFYFGFINCSLRIKNTDEFLQIAPRDLEIIGQIVSIPNSNFANKTKFFFQTDKGKTFVTINDNKNDFSNLKIGNYYQIKGKLRTPFEAVNPSQFDYGNYLKNFGAFTVFYADNSDVKLIDGKITSKWKFLQELNNIRYRILDTHKKYLKSPNIEILGGIVFGDDAVAPPDYIKTIFINSGLLHILAASGMNVAFIYGFWFFLVNKILRLPFKFTVITGMCMIILYSMMTGLGASVVRATIMILFVLAGKLIDRDTHSVALLSLVAMLMLIYNPAYINDVGFQLSFIVTFGLLVSADLLKYNGNKFVGYLRDCFVIPLIAQFWVAPLQMFYFNTFSLYSIFANTITAIFLPLISFCGFISSILSVIPKFADTVCKIFDFVLNPFLNLLVSCSSYFAKLPHSLINTTHPHILQIIIYYTIVLLAVLLFKKFSKQVLYSTLTLVLVLLISTIPIKNHNLEIIAFSVQNADSFLIKTPQNKYFII